MKNLKKIVLGLMLLLAAFAFVGCPTPEQPAPVVPVNNFKGNVYVMTVDMIEFGNLILGYLQFDDDTNGKIVFIAENEETFEEYLEKFAFTYTVKDDVATITLTFDGETESFETSKLENNVFTVEIDDLEMTCKKGDTSLFVKGYAYLDGEQMTSEKSYLATIINVNDLTEEDYVVENGNLILTEVYKEKIQPWTLIYPEGYGEPEEYVYVELFYQLEMFELVENVDYIVDEENHTVTLNQNAMEKIMNSFWSIIYSDEVLGSMPKLYILEEFELYGLVEGEDYIVDTDNKAFILTDSGMAKAE